MRKASKAAGRMREKLQGFVTMEFWVTLNDMNKFLSSSWTLSIRLAQIPGADRGKVIAPTTYRVFDQSRSWLQSPEDSEVISDSASGDFQGCFWGCQCSDYVQFGTLFNPKGPKGPSGPLNTRRPPLWGSPRIRPPHHDLIYAPKYAPPAKSAPPPRLCLSASQHMNCVEFPQSWWCLRCPSTRSSPGKDFSSPFARQLCVARPWIDGLMTQMFSSLHSWVQEKKRTHEDTKM